MKMFFFSVMTGALLFTSCTGGSQGEFQSPPGYDLSKFKLIKLPTELDEISGLAFYPPDTCVFAIADEAGLLYKIYLNRPKFIQKWLFARASDYEDLVLLDSSFYVLSSSGLISEFRFLSKDTLATKDYILPDKTDIKEFEVLYHDPKMARLIMICKDCEADNKQHLSWFSFDPAAKRFDSQRRQINVQQIAALSGTDKVKFKPSAAAIHPLTGELYIVSSINKLLVVCDGEGQAKATYKLDHGDFKQPEGICFMPDGTMLISNESAGQGVANILVFPYRKTARTQS